MSTPKKHVSKAEMEAWQASLGFVFPRKPMLRPDEVATPFGVDLRTVARFFDVEQTREGEIRPWLMGLELNAGRKGERLSRRIPRDNAILLWAHSANYTPADVLNLLFDVLDKRTDTELLAITQRANELIRRRATG
ncbi:MAG TPA: hypothetical protein VL357_03125 [Rariglobus sp.]|jgi:hypothetical protein|nr:hypothetical protein [Rariglobus sp.]